MDFTEHPMSKEIVETNVTDHQSKIEFPNLEYDKMIIDRYSNYRKNNGVKKDNDDNDGSGNESEQDIDRKSTRLNSSHVNRSRMPSSA